MKIKIKYENHFGELSIDTGQVTFEGETFNTIIDAIDRFSKIEVEKKLIENLFETSWL